MTMTPKKQKAVQRNWNKRMIVCSTYGIHSIIKNQKTEKTLTLEETKQLNKIFNELSQILANWKRTI